MKTLAALLLSLSFLQGQPEPAAPQPQPVPAATEETLESLISVPGRWYAGFPLRIKVVDLWRVFNAQHGRIVRVTMQGHEPWERLLFSNNDSRPFLGGAPSWSDDSIEVGNFGPGEHEVTVKVEVFPLSLYDRKNPLLVRTVKRKVVFTTSLDEVCPEPYADAAAAGRLRVTYGGNGLRLLIPEDLRPTMALRVRLLHKSSEIATGEVYQFARDPEYKNASTHCHIDQWNDPSFSPIDFVGKTAPPQQPDAVELIGDPQVAARAGMKRYWTGRVLIPLEQNPYNRK